MLDFDYLKTIASNTLEKIKSGGTMEDIAVAAFCHCQICYIKSINKIDNGYYICNSCDDKIKKVQTIS